MDRQAFIDRYGTVYEDSPWVAARTFDRLGGAPPPGKLADELAATVDAADNAQKRKLVRAHPDLAGRAAVDGALGEASTAEQASAGIDRCTPAEYRQFQELNAAYREKFGFPFVMAVRGSGRQAILDAFRRRLDSDPPTEFATALDHVHRIAALRLAAMAAAENP